MFRKNHSPKDTWALKSKTKSMPTRTFIPVLELLEDRLTPAPLTSVLPLVPIQPATIPAAIATAQPTVPVSLGSGFQQVFLDQFLGNTLDTSKWIAVSGSRGSAIDTPNAISVSGGLLTITTYSTGGQNYTGF